MRESKLLQKGRWYDCNIVSGSLATDTSDAIFSNASISGSYLKMPENFHIIDYVVEVTDAPDSAETFEKGIRLYADGSQGAVLPSVDGFVSIFGRFINE